MEEPYPVIVSTEFVSRLYAIQAVHSHFPVFPSVGGSSLLKRRYSMSEGKFDVDFNEMLDEKLENLLELSHEEMKKGIQEARMLLQKRNERRRLTLTDEVSLMPAEMRCMVFQNYNDSELIDVIVSDIDFESTAGYVLKRRKYVTCLDVGGYRYDYTDHRVLNMEIEIWKSKEANTDNENPHHRIMKKIAISTELSLSDYLCGFTRVVLYYMPASINGIHFHDVECKKLTPENHFGPAPADVTDKFRSVPVHIERDAFAPLLQWICPSALYYNADPKLLFDSHGKLTIEGVEKLWLLEDSSSDRRVVNDVMAKCRSPTIVLGQRAFWARKSVIAVLTEHANSGDAGVARVIDIPDLPSKEHEKSRSAESNSEFPAWGFKGWTLAVWVQRYEDWRTGHVAEYGQPGRDVTYEVKTKTNGDHTFKLVLH